jgi:3-ketosteroid 9alpha-monooxygenase subunit B
MRVNDTLDDHELGIGVRLACQSVPESDYLTAIFDR